MPVSSEITFRTKRASKMTRSNMSAVGRNKHLSAGRFSTCGAVVRKPKTTWRAGATYLCRSRMAPSETDCCSIRVYRPSRPLANSISLSALSLSLSLDQSPPQRPPPTRSTNWGVEKAADWLLLYHQWLKGRARALSLIKPYQQAHFNQFLKHSKRRFLVIQRPFTNRNLNLASDGHE